MLRVLVGEWVLHLLGINSICTPEYIYGTRRKLNKIGHAANNNPYRIRVHSRTSSQLRYTNHALAS
jgi:hypothetical protein